MTQKTVKFDLGERTEKFARDIVCFAKKIPDSTITKQLIAQLIRSGTSIGANYCEADNAISRRDFYHKISICKKEARETIFWLKTFLAILPLNEFEIQKLQDEAKQLMLIFNAIYNKH